MAVPAFLLILSLALGLLGLSSGPPELAYVAVPAALAATFLLLRALARPRKPASPPRWVVVDGSNVLHWQDNTPRLSSLRAVLDRLTEQGFTPGVVFDANAGYKISDRYQHDGALGRLLGLPADRVLVAPKGSPADPLILASARDLDAPIVSNDRFRDWADAHPEIAQPGRLIRGGFRDGKPWLDLD